MPVKLKTMTHLNFINGLTQYQAETIHSLSETLALIVCEVFSQVQNKDSTPSNYSLFCEIYPEDEYGLIERLNTCIQWAAEFEDINKGREWDGEWMDEVCSFVADKLKPIVFEEPGNTYSG